MKIIFFYCLFIVLLPCMAQGRQLRMPSAGDTLHVSIPQFVGTTEGSCRKMTPVPQDEYARHLGFFCRQELKMQQRHIPVLFRVGTMEQCNYLEQKQGYR